MGSNYVRNSQNIRQAYAHETYYWHVTPCHTCQSRGFQDLLTAFYDLLFTVTLQVSKVNFNIRLLMVPLMDKLVGHLIGIRICMGIRRFCD